jgi:hypothetical protein
MSFVESYPRRVASPKVSPKSNVGQARMAHLPVPGRVGLSIASLGRRVECDASLAALRHSAARSF